jgi:tripartite-type tricarboxylate transporter receptor subunit TctC
VRIIPRRQFIALVGASSLAKPLAVRAQQPWPARFVKLVCPIAAGGTIDGTARIVAAKLSEIWGQQVVVENKTGAAGNIAAEAVAHADADGYTVYIATFGHAANKFLYPSINYDPVADFAPVSLVGLYPNIMVVPNSSPAHSVKEFIAYAKANPGKLSYASAGYGSSLHLAGELFQRMAGIEMKHVPYRGAAPAFTDLIPGRIDVMFNLVPSGLPLARAGKVRALGVATEQRIAAAPELPTIAESGVPGFEVSSWSGLFVPARTAPEIVRKISADTVAALADPAIKDKLDTLGVVVVGSTPEGLAKFLKSEMDKWGPVIKDAGIRLN